jgi:hypothetical protein
MWSLFSAATRFYRQKFSYLFIDVVSTTFDSHRVNNSTQNLGFSQQWYEEFCFLGYNAM